MQAPSGGATADVPRIHTLRPMPGSPEDLTAGWLTAALQAGELDVEVGGFETERFGEGAGMLSQLVRIRPRYVRGDGPASLVIKLPTPNDVNRQTAINFQNYRRETLFYRDAAARTPARMPAVYYADVEGTEAFVIVMEDFQGYDVGDQIVGCTVGQARLAMQAMAKLHAPFWDDVDRPEFEFIPYHYPSYHSDGLHQGAIAVWDNMAALAGDALPPTIASLKDRYLAAIPRMQEWITSAPRTVVHGDYRMDNLFFGNTEGQAPVAICDWQGILRGKAAHDVAYFLSQSMPTDERRVHERDLVALWHAGLVDGGVTGYGPEQAWEDYRRSVLYLWTYVAVIGGVLDPSNERGRRWMVEMVRRSAAALEDLDLIPLLAEFE